jgi:hypothetical protein
MPRKRRVVAAILPGLITADVMDVAGFNNAALRTMLEADDPCVSGLECSAVGEICCDTADPNNKGEGTDVAART